MTQQWTVVVDFGGNLTEWEATAFLPDGEQLHWSSNDPHTLMAAIGRDMERESE